MKTALAISVCGVCCVAAGQQAQVQYTWEWSEVVAGTATPSSATPGVIDPTEGVRLTLHALMTPDVGQAVMWVPPPGPGSGTGVVHGWAGNATILRGGAGTAGAFSLPVAASAFVSSTLQELAAGVLSFDAVSELYFGGTTTNTSNPVQGLISFTWTPASYSPRTVSFVSEDPISAGPSNTMWVQRGTGPTGAPLLTATGAIANHGPGTGGIPIVPGPGVAVAMVAWAIVGCRRRRQMGKLANGQMKTALAISVCGVCAAASAQNAQVQYTWEWSEVLAGTATPSSATPGVVDPTEGVRLTLHASFTPDLGQTVMFSHPGGFGPGTVQGWGGTITILRGGAASAGTFSLPVTAIGFQNFTFSTISPGAILVDSVNEWMFMPGANPATSNPVQGLMSFTWTPSSYSPRTVSFVSEDPISAGPPSQLIAQYGTGPTGSPLLWWAGARANHGPGTGAIPIVPGPGGAAAMVAWAIVGCRRRRQMGKFANGQMGK